MVEETDEEVAVGVWGRLAGHGLRHMPDDALLEALDAVSDELKRRNDLTGLGVEDVRSQTPQQNVEMVLRALGELGIRMSSGTVDPVK